VKLFFAGMTMRSDTASMQAQARGMAPGAGMAAKWLRIRKSPRFAGFSSFRAVLRSETYIGTGDRT
jgi:hypothetical protein